MKKIIVTVGPSMWGKISGVHSDKYIYRINGSHANASQAKEAIDKIRSEAKNAVILIDLPGNKIRTANLGQPIILEKGKCFELTATQVNYGQWFSFLKEKDVVLADDSTLEFVVEKISHDKVIFIAHSNGALLNNKGLHVPGLSSAVPFLMEKDKELIALINKEKVDFVGLSFVRTAEDILEAKKIVGKDTQIIAKVETQSAVKHLDDILEQTDHILIDRGDLSADIGLIKVPLCQRFIVEKAVFYNKKVFLATQFLKNMQEKPIPTIAEFIDLYNSLKMGVYGIQLSEETAVGKYPLECLAVIANVLDEIKQESM